MADKNLLEEIKEAKRKGDNLITVLHIVQEYYGYIPEEFIHIISQELNLSRAEVYGVVTFYSDFRKEPPGKHIIKVCRSEACLAMGGRAIQEYIKSKLGINFRETTADGNFTLEDVYCFGNCACAPSVMVDGKLYGRVSLDKMDKILESILKLDGLKHGEKI